MNPARIRTSVLTAVSALGVGCAPAGPAVVAPAVDAEQAALALEARTGLDEPVRILFGWHLNESGIRVSGRGVARIEPPYKARLDLFLGNGETVVRAALVGEELRLPPGAPRNILPPPDLMWGVLGVFHPGASASLVGGDALEGGDLRLRYLYDAGSELHYRVVDGRVRHLQVVERGRPVRTVTLVLDPENRYPLEATYRDVAAFRELRLTRESVELVEPFPPDIWDPSH